MNALVYKSTGSWYVIKDENDKFWNARIKGVFKIDDITSTNPLAVGDVVEIETENESEGSATIINILPRRNYINRQSPRHKFQQHIIAANLPYVAPEELSSLQPEIRLYEPQSALVSEKNGLAHIEALLIQAPNKLILGGKILLEIGSTQGEAVTLLARQYFPYASVEVKKDLAGLDRIVIIST